MKVRRLPSPVLQMHEVQTPVGLPDTGWGTRQWCWYNFSITDSLWPQIYCKNCYSYTHGHKSKANLHDADCSQLQGEEGEADVCPRCSGKVWIFKMTMSKSIAPASTRFLRLRSRLRSQGATTGSVSPAPSANTRWTQQTLPTDPTTRWQHFSSYIIRLSRSTASTATSWSTGRRRRRSRCPWTRPPSWARQSWEPAHGVLARCSLDR